jgi:hypothetical protein
MASGVVMPDADAWNGDHSLRWREPAARPWRQGSRSTIRTRGEGRATDRPAYSLLLERQPIHAKMGGLAP